MENSQSFNINFQQRFDKSNSNSHRKHIAYILKGASTQLNNQDVCSLVANELHSYTNNNYQEKLYDKLNSVLSQSNRIIGTNFTSNLDKIDPKQYIKPLTCTINKSYCPQSEQFPEHEFIQLMEVFKNKNINHSSMPNQFNQSKQVLYPENKSDKINKNKKIEQSSFKTAREELEVQIGLKYGNAQKKKLGNRGRGVNSKFIPPILANSGSNEDVKLESKLEDPSKFDKRLQNIEAKMIELIKSEIMDCNTDLHWDDIAGLNFAKTAIQEAVVWPLLRPDIFTGLRRPPKGILLFGPPGTGKTLIGKCVASQSKSTFFSISASSLTSKWVGDGEKMVRALFAVARVEQPSVIFIDEVDSLLSQRTDTEHESSRRIKTEFLVQLDGAATDSEERLLVIGATNRPQELDEAARRRFVKRLYIPLPEIEARLQLVKKLISNEKHELSQEDFDRISVLSDGHSGADIKNLCSEASLGPIRSIDFNQIENIQVNDVRPVRMEDFEKAFNRVRSSVSPKDLEHYIRWDKLYGSGF